MVVIVINMNMMLNILHYVLVYIIQFNLTNRNLFYSAVAIVLHYYLSDEEKYI